MQKGRIYCLLNDAGKVVGHTYTQKVNALRAWRRMPAYKQDQKEGAMSVKKTSSKTFAGRLARKTSGWARPGHFDKGIPQGSISRERSVETLLTTAESNGGWEKWPTLLGAMGYGPLHLDTDHRKEGE